MRGNDRLSERVIRRTFNIPIGPDFIIVRGPAGLRQDRGHRAPRARLDGVRAGARGAPDHAGRPGGATQPGRGRGGLHRVGEGPGRRASVQPEHVRLRRAGVAPAGGERGRRRGASSACAARCPSSTASRTGSTPTASRTSPGSSTRRGTRSTARDFERSGVDLALQAPLERWGLRGGRPAPRQGDDEGEGRDRPARRRGLRAHLLRGTWSSTAWTACSGRSPGSAWPSMGWWNAEDMGATRPFWRVEARGAAGPALRRSGSSCSSTPSSVSPATICRSTTGSASGGPISFPATTTRSSRGRRRWPGAVSVRYRVVGQLQAVARVGTGNVYDSRSDITLDDLRWGVGVGLVYQSRVGPLALEVGWRDGGASLFRPHSAGTERPEHPGQALPASARSAEGRPDQRGAPFEGSRSGAEAGEGGRSRLAIQRSPSSRESSM